MALAVRCIPSTIILSFLVSVQLLDGIGAGIFGVMQFLVIADLTKVTGHFNLAQGGIGAAVGIGASLSNSLAGFVAKEVGYNASFLSIAAIAPSALAFFWFFMPETKFTSHWVNSQSELTTVRE